MDEERYAVPDVPALFEDCAKLSWKELAAKCARISSKTALEICDAVVNCFNDLSNEQRFHICAGPRDRQPTQITGWTDCRETGLIRYAEYFMPTPKAILAQDIVYKAGVSHWLKWLNSFPDHAQVVALLLEAQRRNWDLLQAFELSCNTEDASNIRTILFCLFISEEQQKSEQDSFLNTVRMHGELFMELCLEVLTDFRFQMAYPEKEAVYDAIASLCANDGALARLRNAPTMTIGVLSAWAKLLTLLDPTQEHISQFKTAYFDWVAETNDYMFLFDTKGQYYSREIDFLNFLIAIFALDDSAIEQLRLLWKKKTSVYHRWNSKKKNLRQQWFQHIGLILWCIGVEEYRRNGNTDLVVCVLTRLNDTIPMMLTEHDYQLLVRNVFCTCLEDVTAINVPLCSLIHKIYEPSLLCGVVSNYLGLDDQRADVLHAMRDRLQLMSKLPQKTSTPDLHTHMEELLLKIESHPV